MKKLVLILMMQKWMMTKNINMLYNFRTFQLFHGGFTVIS
jgi:hypothetical protein